MARIDEIMKELDILIKEGFSVLQVGVEKDVDLFDLSLRYEPWYTKALSVITAVTPERAADFHDAYRVDHRKGIHCATYTISDYLSNLVVRFGNEPTFDTSRVFASKMIGQLGIVQAAAGIAPTVLHDIRTTLQAELMDSDLEAATELQRAGYLRPAGVVCGVVLESHLRSVSDRHSIPIRKKHATIGDYNDALKEAKVYDTPTWRLVLRLADIRNLCGHSKDREPTKDEVQDLISGTDKIIKEVF